MPTKNPNYDPSKPEHETPKKLEGAKERTGAVRPRPTADQLLDAQT
jgi:hypothetical protein